MLRKCGAWHRTLRETAGSYPYHTIRVQGPVVSDKPGKFPKRVGGTGTSPDQLAGEPVSSGFVYDSLMPPYLTGFPLYFWGVPVYWVDQTMGGVPEPRGPYEFILCYCYSACSDPSCGE